MTLVQEIRERLFEKRSLLHLSKQRTSDWELVLGWLTAERLRDESGGELRTTFCGFDIRIVDNVEGYLIQKKESHVHQS